MNGLVVRRLRLDVGSRGVDVVDEIELEIAAGSVLALVGESGSGKTSVGLAMLGYTRPGVRIAGGDVHVDGVPMPDSTSGAGRALRGGRISYIAQDPASSLNPALRTGAQILQVLDAHHPDMPDEARNARLADVLREVSLPSDRDFLSRYPHQLSGGERQRVGLAIGFICRPTVVVLDEPTTGLDVSVQRHVLDTIRDLCQHHHVAAMYITHDLAVVASVADQVAVMYAGRVVEQGPTTRVFANPAHPYTRHLLDAEPAPIAKRSMIGLRGAAPGPGARPLGCSFAPRCEHAHDGCRVGFPRLVEVEQERWVRCVSPFAVPTRIGRDKAIPWPSTGGDGPVLLAVEDLLVHYGRRRVVNVHKLEIEHGECLALVGESGSGKTSLARSIVGMHHEWTGSVRISGVELARAARDRPMTQRRRIQLVSQDPSQSFNPRRTIGESVARPLRIAGASAADSRRTVGDMFEQLRLDQALTGRYPHQLSGGERQRAAIARALVARPDLLICDEVTSALDNLAQAAIGELLVDLQREFGLTLLFVTHHLGLASALAGRMAVMADGRIVETGSTQAILTNPESEPAKRLVADTLPSPRRSHSMLFHSSELPPYTSRA